MSQNNLVMRQCHSINLEKTVKEIEICQALLYLLYFLRDVSSFSSDDNFISWN